MEEVWRVLEAVALALEEVGLEVVGGLEEQGKGGVGRVEGAYISLYMYVYI